MLLHAISICWPEVGPVCSTVFLIKFNSFTILIRGMKKGVIVWKSGKLCMWQEPKIFNLIPNKERNTSTKLSLFCTGPHCRNLNFLLDLRWCVKLHELWRSLFDMLNRIWHRVNECLCFIFKTYKCIAFLLILAVFIYFGGFPRVITVFRHNLFLEISPSCDS